MNFGDDKTIILLCIELVTICIKNTRTFYQEDFGKVKTDETKFLSNKVEKSHNIDDALNLSDPVKVVVLRHRAILCKVV